MDEIIQQIIFKNAAKIDLFLIGKTLIEIVLFIIILRIVNKTLHLFFEKLLSRISDTETKKHYQTLRQLGIYIIDAIIILFFATNILGNFGIDMKPILATAGILGVAVGFGGKKFVEDLFTGLSIILTGQLRVGDYVTVNNSTGTVEKVTLTMIVIRAFNGDVHYLRNGQIDTIINQTKNFSFPIFNISVAYKTDVTHAMKVLRELGQELRQNPTYSRFVLSDIEVLGLNEFQDSAIIIQCRIKTTPQEQWMVKRKFNQMVKERFEKEGIEIPFPQVVVNKAEG
ncbi:TPA: mechanosensitive ion channel family protein [Candidatus Avigastranaerophilus faecigallinarum]|nr:mechanosensitive ion channel family protein [Candidatus Avigastranaerophilus faecigallinarum]